MKAMILAAGLGTRLRPITNNKPKALVEIDGVPVIERVIYSLCKQGFNDIFVNVHHFADMIKEFLKSKDFGVKIRISDESGELLDTGGGIVKAMPLLFEKDNTPVLIHNVDILSNACLEELMRGAEKEVSGGLLLVSDRDSNRKLCFDADMNLRGWHDIQRNISRPTNFTPDSSQRQLAFSGIYVLNRQSIEEMKYLIGETKFSIMDYFLHSGRKIRMKGFLQENLELIDIGKPATLLQAQKENYIKS